MEDEARIAGAFAADALHLRRSGVRRGSRFETDALDAVAGES
jgi:hypothetical protein